MWTVVYMIQSKDSALKLQEIFKEKNIHEMIRPVGENNSNKDYFEVLVPDTEVQKAHDIILEQGL